LSHGPYPRERIYAYSTSEREKDHIEDAVASYVNAMSPALYAVLSEGNDGYLREEWRAACIRRKIL
jgi:hypothetical protein